MGMMKLLYMFYKQVNISIIKGVLMGMNKVDMLCKRVNNKFGLRNRQIGSVERYTDSSTNSVV